MSPEDLDVRPTPDRLREALFNILAPRIADAVFLDAYAGCGSVGIEALSRGASKCIFIERSKKALEVLRANIHSLRLEHRCKVVHGSATTYLSSLPADIIFLDPPYNLTEEYERSLALAQAPLVIAQHPSKKPLPEQLHQWTRYRELKQGDNTLSFFSATSGVDAQ